MTVARTQRQAKIHSKDLERQSAIDSLMELATTEDGAELLTEIESKVVARRKALKDDPLGFIYRYVKILDPDNGGMLPFHLWPEQAKALRQIHENRRVVVLKARQLGLSWVALAYAAHQLLFKPGFTIVVMSRGEAESKEMLFRLKVILENLPKWITRHTTEAESGWPGPIWDCGVLKCEVRHQDGSISRLLGEEAAPNSGRSFTAGMVILDEWAFQEWARDIWKAAYPTINRPNGGKIIGISTFEAGTLFQDIWENAVAGKNNFVPIFLPWNADPNRDQKWYDDTLLDLGPNDMAIEYPSTPDDVISFGARKSFPEFNYKVHTVEPFPIPADWTRMRAYDHGFVVDPACNLWLAVDYQKNIWVYREFYQKHVQVPDIAARILELEQDLDDPLKPQDDDGNTIPETITRGVADYQIFDRTGATGPTPADEFAKYGILWEKSLKDRTLGWAEVHSRLAVRDGKPTIYIFRTCENLIREINRARTTTNNTDAVDKAKCDDHALDALRYGLMAQPRAPVKPKPLLPIWQRRRGSKNREGSWMARA